MAREVKAGIKIEVNTKQGTTAVDKFSSRFKDAFTGVGLATAVAGKAVNLFQGLLTKLAATVRESIALANEQEAAERGLAAALSLRGENTDENIKRINAFNSAIQASLGIGDERLLQIQATLSALGIEASQLAEATRATIGLTTITKNLESSARLVGRAFTGEVSALTRYGITAKSVGEVQEKLGGLFKIAEAQAGTFATQTSILEKNVGDLGETLGFMVTKSDLSITAVSDLALATKGLDIALKNTNKTTALFTLLLGEMVGATDGTKKSQEKFSESLTVTKEGLLETIGPLKQAATLFFRLRDSAKAANEEAKKLAEELEKLPKFTKLTSDEIAKSEAIIEKAFQKRLKLQKDIREEAIKDQFAIEEASEKASAEILANEKKRAVEIQTLLDEEVKQNRTRDELLAQLDRNLQGAKAQAELDRRQEEIIRREEQGNRFAQIFKEQADKEIAENKRATMAIGSGLATTFGAAIRGTETVGAAFERLATRIAEAFAAKTILRIFGFLTAPLTGFLGPLGSLLGFEKGGVVPKRMAHGGIVTGGTRGRDSVPVLAQEGEAFLPPDLTKALQQVLGVQGGSSFAGGGVVSGGGNTTIVLQQLVPGDRASFRRTVRDIMVPELRALKRSGVKI